MSQHYSDPERASETYALPDVEVYYYDGSEIFEGGYEGRCDDCNQRTMLADGFGSEQNLCVPCAREQFKPGWYWRTCFPGCMPDSDPFGPFATEAKAVADAQEQE